MILVYEKLKKTKEFFSFFDWQVILIFYISVLPHIKGTKISGIFTFPSTVW